MGATGAGVYHLERLSFPYGRIGSCVRDAFGPHPFLLEEESLEREKKMGSVRIILLAGS